MHSCVALLNPAARCQRGLLMICTSARRSAHSYSIERNIRILTSMPTLHHAMSTSLSTSVLSMCGVDPYYVQNNYHSSFPQSQRMWHGQSYALTSSHDVDSHNAWDMPELLQTSVLLCKRCRCYTDRRPTVK